MSGKMTQEDAKRIEESQKKGNNDQGFIDRSNEAANRNEKANNNANNSPSTTGGNASK
ncbi:hypothetical protein FRB94_004672 [Tulasnella sp. JGI-2019a]|nr:hypothetical protein FRB94_004672 [Tulasnella sp. JGI-2019a]KAG9029726.1 hypothetical protein FRB95_004976 [Tulasnella sp. JGI-2019a]